MMHLETDPHFMTAREIVATLHQAGYIAYFAGGWVRDLLLGHPADDIDIASGAPPEKVMELFPHTVAVGAAFGVVLVIHHGYSFEVTSFRTDGLYLYGRRPETIQFSSPEEDAKRRDLTVNGMFYDPLTHTVIDYVGGEEDLRRGIVRAIGDADQRIQEDRLRMMRAVRLMARFDFTMDDSTRQAIRRYSTTLLPAVAVERVWQELQKMASFPGMARGILELHTLGLLSQIFPELSSVPRADIEFAVGGFSQYPKGTPAILYLLQLLIHLPPNKLETIFRRFNIAQADLHLLLHYLKLRQFYESPSITRTEWVSAYSHPHAKTCIEVYAASELSEEKKAPFLAFHTLKMQELQPHILRCREKRPLLMARDLIAQGQTPGPFLGLLVKEGERLAIEHDLKDAESVLRALKETSLWKRR